MSRTIPNKDISSLKAGRLAGLAAPQPGDTICDPACGSGSLLICAAEQVGSDNFALYGQEVNGATWALDAGRARP